MVKIHKASKCMIRGAQISIITIEIRNNDQITRNTPLVQVDTQTSITQSEIDKEFSIRRQIIILTRSSRIRGERHLSSSSHIISKWGENAKSTDKITERGTREEIRIQMQKVTKEARGIIATIRIPLPTDATMRGLLKSTLRSTTIRTLIDETTELCQNKEPKILAKLN